MQPLTAAMPFKPEGAPQVGGCGSAVWAVGGSQSPLCPSFSHRELPEAQLLPGRVRWKPLAAVWVLPRPASQRGQLKAAGSIPDGSSTPTNNKVTFDWFFLQWSSASSATQKIPMTEKRDKNAPENLQVRVDWFPISPGGQVGTAAPPQALNKAEARPGAGAELSFLRCQLFV